MNLTLSKKSIVLIVGLLALITVSIIPSIFFYTKYTQTKSELNKTKNDLPDETKALVQKVGKHYALTQDEVPTIATIKEIEKLRDEPFFAKAKNGDRVLIYDKWKRAILYDPKADIILEIGAINFDNSMLTPTEVTPPPLDQ